MKMTMPKCPQTGIGQERTPRAADAIAVVNHPRKAHTGEEPSGQRLYDHCGWQSAAQSPPAVDSGQCDRRGAEPQKFGATRPSTLQGGNDSGRPMPVPHLGPHLRATSRRLSSHNTADRLSIPAKGRHRAGPRGMSDGRLTAPSLPATFPPPPGTATRTGRTRPYRASTRQGESQPQPALAPSLQPSAQGGHEPPAGSPSRI